MSPPEPTARLHLISTWLRAEIGTYAVDGPDQASLAGALTHAG